MTMKILVNSRVFQALLDANLLVEIPPSAKTPWSTWGMEVEIQPEDELIECTLVEGCVLRVV